MTAKNQNPNGETSQLDAQTATAAKKTFVEPTISQPVDVLEATTFFQVVDSGGTGIKKGGGD